jgi:amino acid transporter
MTTLFIIGGMLLIIMIVLFIFMLSIKFDQEHNASKDSVHYKLFNILRFGGKHDHRPKTICAYYWKYVQYIVSIPLTLPLVLFGVFFKKKRDTNLLYTVSFIILVFTTFGSMIGHATFIDGIENPIMPIWLACLTGTGILIFLLAMAAGIMVGTSIYLERRKPIFKEKKDSMIKVRIKAWKEKNCPMINWK